MYSNKNGIPDSAFTELELAAGVPDVYRENVDKDLLIPKDEIESHLTREELMSELAHGVCNGGVTFDVMMQSYPSFGRYSLSSIELSEDGPWPNLYFEINNDEISFTSLVNAMRESGIPLIDVYGTWVAWDEREKRIRTKLETLEKNWYSSFGAWDKKPLDSMNATELQLMKFLSRSFLSTDHGKKSIIISRECYEKAKHCEKIEFKSPSIIQSDEYSKYVLAFYDSTGISKSIPLQNVIDLGYPIVTRTAAYIIDHGCLAPMLSNAKLLACAFLIARSYRPSQFVWYELKTHGTLFESAIDKVESPDIRNEDSSVTFFDDIEEYLIIATSIAEWAKAHGSFYIAIDGHPIDAELVTTPDLYLHAVRTLSKFGYVISYNYKKEKVEVLKADEWNLRNT